MTITATMTISAAARAVAAAVTKDGDLDAVGGMQPAVFDTDKKALKDLLRQSLLLLHDGSYA
eukprot:1845073-Prymnesium_polylepis.1